jgi:hypothetical protein
MKALSIEVITRQTEDGRLAIETSVKTDSPNHENHIKFSEIVDPLGPSRRRPNGTSIAPILLAAIGQIDRINATMLMHEAGREGEGFIDPALLWVD